MPSSSQNDDRWSKTLPDRASRASLAGSRRRPGVEDEAETEVVMTLRALQISSSDVPRATGHEFIPVDAAIHLSELPEQGSWDVLYLPNVVEQLSPAAATALLRACVKALRPGGRLRVTALDLDAILRRVSSQEAWESEGWKKHRFDWKSGRIHALNMMLKDREWCYNADEMRLLCGVVGLREGTRVDTGSDGPYVAEEMGADTLAMEFVRPSREASDKPLVSILIALYKSEFFLDALRSALDQTWENIEIVICNDGPTEPAEAVLEALKSHPRFGCIRYQKNPNRLLSLGNYRECIRLARGRYLKFLNDDDLLEPTCVAKMAACLRDHPEVTLVTSHRRVIDVNGAPLGDIGPTIRPVRESSIVDGRSAIDVLLRQQMNFIGEPSTTMFRKEDVAEAEPHFTSIFGLDMAGNSDVGAWIALLAHGDLIYLTDTLSSFRVHTAQEQHDPRTHSVCVAWWNRAAEWAKFCGLYSEASPLRLHAVPLIDLPWWPPAVREHHASASSAIREGRWQNAEAAIHAALTLLPGEPRLELLRVRWLAASGQNSIALQTIASILEGARETVPLLLECATIAAAAGDTQLSNSAIGMAHGAHPLLVPVAGVHLGQNETSLTPRALFQLAADLPEIEVRFSLKCMMSSDDVALPLVMTSVLVDSRLISSSVLRGYGSEAQLIARIPRSVQPVRIELLWQSAHSMFPSPTTERGTVMLTGLFLAIPPSTSDF
jgi:glycosyltransferase involved in cell wall biosynthesis